MTAYSHAARIEYTFSENQINATHRKIIFCHVFLLVHMLTTNERLKGFFEALGLFYE